MKNSTNFHFTSKDWPDIFTVALEAEKLTYLSPRSSCFNSRLALERILLWLYDHEPELQKPYEENLGSLLFEPSLKTLAGQVIHTKMVTIQKQGNRAAHNTSRISDSDSRHLLNELFHICVWFYKGYSKYRKAGEFFKIDFSIIPKEGEPDKNKIDIEELKKVQEKYLSEKEKADRIEVEAQKKAGTYEEEIKKLQSEIEQIKKKNNELPVDHDYSEAETRTYFIDLLIRESGWDLDAPNVKEYPVIGMPSDSGDGYVDYVLWGTNGLPLAVIEAKRSSKNPHVGQRQAELYADCLEKMHGQRPIIFYTNGYETWLWDDVAGYPPRQVQGIYKKDELERLINRRSVIRSLKDLQVNPNIAGRYYQVEAIRQVCENFEKKRRASLIVCATGTGKTRLTIALVELLQKANWAKNILFLADRNALVKQARDAFNEHLPNTACEKLSGKTELSDARVIVSTYPTMMNAINETKEDVRLFSPGHFDLIIVDEAHRSIYSKFQAIFDYFDSLLVGLTATPKAEVDKNTYELFGHEDHAPTYAYEAATAYKDGFLVPPRALDVPLKFVREGVKYEDLSDQEKIDYEEEENFYDDEGVLIEEISSSKLNKWLFNQNTVDQVLKYLMENGIKVKGGDQLGKTIIFAKNQEHAEFIEKRFNSNYPHYAGKFLRVITYRDNYAQSTLDEFKKEKGNPWIAVSVDMLDTGVDVPEIVNLVFFKAVKSRVKFLQMIGRGTRLRPDLFGPGMDKGYFLCFDYCGNFEYFNENPEGATNTTGKSLSEKLFLNRIDLIREMEKEGRLKDEKISKVNSSLLDWLYGYTEGMNPDNFIVRPHLKTLERFNSREKWNIISEQDKIEVCKELASLPTTFTVDENEMALRFDLINLYLQLSFLRGTADYAKHQSLVISMASALEGKLAIPLVKAQAELIDEMQKDEWWENITIDILEDMRFNLRNLIQFIDRPESKPIVYTDFKDEMLEVRETSAEYVTGASDELVYRKRVEEFIKKQLHTKTVNKIKYNIPVTKEDLLDLETTLYSIDVIGTKDKFAQVFHLSEKGLGVFIRSLVGLDRSAAKDAFGKFLEGGSHTAKQIAFINLLIEHLARNGTIEAGQLYESPYIDIDHGGPEELFGNEADELFAVIEQINANAIA